MNRKVPGKYFLQLPVSVIDDERYSTMSKPGRDAVWALAMQYRGRNNGDLILTRTSIAAAHVSMRARDQGRREAEAAGFVVTVRTGARYQKMPTRFALSFRPLDFDRDGKKLEKPLPVKSWVTEQWALDAHEYAVERWEVIRKTLAEAESRRRRRKMSACTSAETESRPQTVGIHGPEPQVTTAPNRGHTRPRATAITAPVRRHNLESGCTCEVPAFDIVESGVQPGSDGIGRHFLATSRLSLVVPSDTGMIKPILSKRQPVPLKVLRKGGAS